MEEASKTAVDTAESVNSLGRDFHKPAATLLNTTRQIKYVVGEAYDYRSCYGYAKRRIAIYKLQPGDAVFDSQDPVGWIKEELIPDESGKIIGAVYYEKNQWRQDGWPRFYASPEALLIACSMPVLNYEKHLQLVVPGTKATNVVAFKKRKTASRKTKIQKTRIAKKHYGSKKRRAAR